jgi:hypothetical protein
MTPITLDVNGQQLRLRRLNEINLVIERWVEPVKAGIEGRWVPFRFYGKLEDLATGLIDLSVSIPEGPELAIQSAALRSEVQALGKTICEQIKSSSASLNR